MNDPFADRLRALKPGLLPDELRDRLADPPDLTVPVGVPTAGTPSRRSPVILKAVFAVSAAAAAVIAISLFREAETPYATGPAAPAFAGSEASRVTGLRPLSVVTDAGNRTWKLMEVSWVEENTLVDAAHPVAVQLEDHYRTVVPVAVQFD